jgi:outer membrane protein
MLLKKLIPVLFLCVGTSAFAQFKIATVDMNRVFTNYWKTKEAQRALDEHRTDIEKTDKEMVANFTKARDEYQKVKDSAGDPAVSAEEREKREKDAELRVKDLREQQDNLEQFERGSQATLAEQLKRTRDNIVADIKVAVTAKAKTDGYTLVIDTGSQTVNGTPVVLYCVSGDNDLTDAVIKQMNVGAPVETTKPDDKGTPKGSGK